MDLSKSRTQDAKENKQPPASNEGVYTSVEDLLAVRYYCKDFTIDTRKKSSAILDGDAKTHFRGRGMDFAEVRPYQPGDDIRNIDWRVTARTQKTYTKLFQEERERPVYILLDQRSSMFFGSQRQFKSVLAAKIAAAIAWISLNNNDRIGALIFSNNKQTDCRAKRGRHAVLSLLNSLSEFNNDLNANYLDTSHEVDNNSEIDLAQMLSDLRRVAKPGSSIFIISDFHDYDASCKESLAMLSRHTDLTLLRTYDPMEKNLPFGQSLSISDGNRKSSLANLGGRTAKAFADSFDDISYRIKTDCGQLGIKNGLVATSYAVEKSLTEIFTSYRTSNKKSPRV